jgi:hypothetical protein
MKDNRRSAHQAFRKVLVQDLLMDLLPKAPKRSYITNTALPNLRLARPIKIHQQVQGKQAACELSCVTKRVKVISKKQVQFVVAVVLICA